VYDPVGGEMFAESLRCMAPVGRLVSVGFAAGSIPEVPANILLVKNLDVIGLYWGHYLNWGRQPAGQLLLDQVRAAFSTMFDWALDGKLAPRTYRSFPLEEFAAALDLISSREVIGRVVFLPRAGR
jgi:NADPH2:quinone reductase